MTEGDQRMVSRKRSASEVSGGGNPDGLAEQVAQIPTSALDPVDTMEEQPRGLGIRGGADHGQQNRRRGEIPIESREATNDS